MSKNSPSKCINKFGRVLIKKSPAILTGLGIGGMATAVILGITATPKAIRLIEAKKKAEHKDKLSPAETAKTVWKCYIPAAALFAGATACLIGANSVHTKRQAALATAYSLSEAALREYQDKVVETIGEKKEQTIRDAIAKDKMERMPVDNHEVVMTGKGDTLCYDILSGRYFKSDIDKLKKVENILNRRMIGDMCITLNEFYEEIGLPDIPVGESIGWNVNKALIEMVFSSQLATDGTPCLVVGFRNVPVYEYDQY